MDEAQNKYIGYKMRHSKWFHVRLHNHTIRVHVVSVGYKMHDRGLNLGSLFPNLCTILSCLQSTVVLKTPRFQGPGSLWLRGALGIYQPTRKSQIRINSFLKYIHHVQVGNVYFLLAGTKAKSSCSGINRYCQACAASSCATTTTKISAVFTILVFNYRRLQHTYFRQKERSKKTELGNVSPGTQTRPLRSPYSEARWTAHETIRVDQTCLLTCTP
jgi:hypothetical protein